MTLDEWCGAKWGRTKKLSRALNINNSFLHRMRRGQAPIPAAMAVKIEIATGKQVTRKDMRPNDWFEIWPDLLDLVE